MLSVTYKIVVKDNQALKSLSLKRQECEDISREYMNKRNNLFEPYLWLVLQDERQEGRIPAWEGIRIVRERIQ